MSFLEKIKILFKENWRYPKIYFGKSMKSVPPGAFVLFPVQHGQLNCGLTGIVTFKKKGSARSKIPISKIESMISQLKGYTYKRIKGDNKDLIEDYLGGEAFLGELQDLIGDLKITSSLYTILKETPTRDRLKKISYNLKEVTGGEEKEHHKALTLLSLE